MMARPIHTADGSTSLYSEKYGEPYHSRHGAVSESMHVFLAMGLDVMPEEKKEIRILEMGLGTGLNALLTCLHKGDRQVYYTALEAEPLEQGAWEVLNFDEMLKGQVGVPELLEAIHEAPWEEDRELQPGFTLIKHRIKLQDFDTAERFDLVYFDAFAPEAQPELWTESIFARIFAWLNPGAILVTYSAKGAVRRAMLAAGFQVEKAPGPPGKREMLRAQKII